MKSINDTFFTSLLIALSSLSMPKEALLMKIFIFIFFAGISKHSPDGLSTGKFTWPQYHPRHNSSLYMDWSHTPLCSIEMQYPILMSRRKKNPPPNEIYCLMFSFSLIGGIWGAGCETAKVELTKNSATFHTFFKFFDHLLTTKRYHVMILGMLEDKIMF